MGHTILILEDDGERIAAFRNAVASLGPQYSLRLWHEAPAMICECPALFSDTCLISLDYQLMRMPGAKGHPGNGMDVAAFLCNQKPVCPVIIHTSAYGRRASMFNALSFAKWDAHIVAPLSPFWIRDAWTPMAKRLLQL
jgi:FixJ family two-component response regulator